MKLHLHIVGPSWVVPCIGLALACVPLLRAAPVFPPPAHNRLVVDASARPVSAPDPLPGVIGWTTNYLQLSHRPDLLLGSINEGRAGFARSLMGRIYPELPGKPIWDVARTLETVLAGDIGGLYFAGGDARLGMFCIAIWPPGLPGDQTTFTMARITNDALGQPELTEVSVARYEREFSAFRKDFQPQALPRNGWPRMLRVVYAARDWTRLLAEGIERDLVDVRDAATGWMNAGRGSDAERMPAMADNQESTGYARFAAAASAAVQGRAMRPHA